jgi:hypothetical protein
MKRFRSAHIAAASILFLSLAGPAMAYKWPGDGPSIGGAVAAKSIGRHCKGVLTGADMAEIETFLSKAAADYAAVEKERAASRHGYKPRSLDSILAALATSYDGKYGDGGACGGSAAEEARDMLARIRKMMAAGGSVFALPSDPDRIPDTAEVMQARIVGEKCEGVLSATQLAELNLYVAKAHVRFARKATDADGRTMLDHESSSEAAMARDFQPARDCTLGAVAEARQTAARVSRIEASTAK